MSPYQKEFLGSYPSIPLLLCSPWLVTILWQGDHKDCDGTTIESKILASGLPEQLQDFSDLLVYHLGIGKLKRNHGGVEEGRDSVFLYRITNTGAVGF